MIFKSAFPNAPTVKMVIDGVAVDYTSINSVDFSFSENEHDYCEIVVAGLIPTAITDYANRPVYISVSYGPTQITSFYGYVGYVEPEIQSRMGLVNRSPVQTARIVCFGASYDMKGVKSRVWDNYTLPKLVEKLSKEYGYSYAVPDDSFIISRLSQIRESDWELLVRACHMLGYRVTASGGHIHVYDPFKVIGRNMPYAELTTINSSAGHTTFAPGRVMEFRGVFGQVTPEGSSNNFVFESLDNSGQLIKAESGAENTGFGEPVPARFTDKFSTNAVSIATLNKIASALSRNIMPYHAEAVVTGLPGVIPGSVVQLNGYDSKFDGFWMIKSVKHQINRSNYITLLKIVRDSTNETTPAIVNAQAYVEPDSPIIRDGTWVAPVKEGYVYL